MMKSLEQILNQVLKQKINQNDLNELKDQLKTDMSVVNSMNPSRRDSGQSENISTPVTTRKVTRNLIQKKFESAVKDLFLQRISVKDQLKLFQFLLELKSEQCITDFTLLTIIEWAFEMGQLSEIKDLFSFIEVNLLEITKGFQPNKGAQLILLRICNELIKRVTPINSDDATFCGRVRTLLANTVAVNDRSGLNLGGLFNTENQLKFELESNQELDLNNLPTEPKEDQLYILTWTCQNYFKNPQKSILQYTDDARQQQMDRMKKIFQLVVKNLVLQYSNSLNIQKESIERETSQFDRYLSSRSSFSVLIKDIKFITQYLIQSLIFLRFLKYKFNKELEASQDETLLKALQDDIEWIDNAAIFILNSIDKIFSHEGSSKLLRTIFKQEDNWMKWKDQQCPLYEKAPTQLNEVKLQNIPKFRAKWNLGNPELHKLWKVSEKDLTSPSLDLVEFLEPLKEQMDPEAQVEEEYRLSKDPSFSWKVARLLLQSNPKVINQEDGDMRPYIDLIDKNSLFNQSGLFDPEVLVKKIQSTEMQIDS